MKFFTEKYPLYLVLFCIQAPISYFQIFGYFYNYYNLAPVILIFFLFGILLFIFAHRFVRDIQLAGFMALSGLILLFPIPSLSVPILLIGAVVGFGLIGVQYWRHRKNSPCGTIRLPQSFTYVITVMAVLTTIAVVGKPIVDTVEESAVVETLSAKTLTTLRHAVTDVAPRPLPHIVHIVLDGYSRADVLRDVYGFDNAPFLNGLRKRGFRVATHATSPYNQTLLVMSSILLLRPITDTDLFRNSGMNQNTRSPQWNRDKTRKILSRSVRQGSVSKILRDLGYQKSATPTAYLPMQLDNVVTEDQDLPFVGRFALPETYLLANHMLKHSPIPGYLIRNFLNSYFSYSAINYKNLTELPNRQFRPSELRPRFIFEHVLAPHPPFNIGSDGAPVSYEIFKDGLSDGSSIIHGDSGRRAVYHDAYLNKLRYVNDAILAHVDRLKETLDGPLVIILHGDHGGGLHLNHDHFTKSCASERFKPLLAVFATDETVLAEYSNDFNIINIYRALFRALLNAELPDLPSRSTFVSWNLDEITSIDKIALNQPCIAPRRVWTAEDNRVPLQSTKPSISR